MKIRRYLAILTCTAAIGLPLQAPDASEPNVIIFMADDLGQDVVPLYTPETEDPDFPENPPMPTLEELAEDGVAFKYAWAMPTCSVHPRRAVYRQIRLDHRRRAGHRPVHAAPRRRWRALRR